MVPRNALPSSIDAQRPSPEFSADVIVIGAGISGLACAAHLRSAGKRVIVLEARHRPGGRLHTITLSDGPESHPHSSYAVDLGAAWVHGIGSAGAPNQLYGIAYELGLRCRPTDYSDAAVYTADGVRLPEGDVADIERLYQAFEQHLQSLLHAPDPRLALMPIQAAQDAFAAAHGLSPAQSAALSFAVSNHMEHYWAGEARAMGVAALDEVVLPGGDVVLTEGYDGIVRRLAAGLDVRLGHQVVAVQYGGSVVVVTVVNASGGEVMTLTARAAVVTLPIGVLRSGAVEFRPPLAAVDPKKAAAIDQLGIAVYNKVVMLYDLADVFWDDTAFIYRIPAPWEGGRWAYFLNMHKVTGAPILVAFNLGESACQLEAVSDTEAVEGALRALAGMYGADRVRRPRQAVVTRWGSDPHSRMSYTYIRAGLTGAAFDDLARPVLGCLYFAGEATHRRHYGTAHGAYDSGQLAASAILSELDGVPPLLPPLPPPMRKWAVTGHPAVVAAGAAGEGVAAAAVPPPLARLDRAKPRPKPRWRPFKAAVTATTAKLYRGDASAATASAAAAAASPMTAATAVAVAAAAATAGSASLCLAPTGGTIQQKVPPMLAAAKAAAAPFHLSPDSPHAVALPPVSPGDQKPCAAVAMGGGAILRSKM